MVKGQAVQAPGHTTPRAPPTSKTTISEPAYTLNLEDWDNFLNDYVDNDQIR